MNHNEIRHKLSDYIDNSLMPEEKVSVEAHLRTCPECSNALSELQKTVEHVRSVEEVEPPTWMTQKIMARVRAEEEKKKQGLFQRLFFPLHIKLPLETIGVLFVAVAVYFVVQDVQRDESFPEARLQNYSMEQQPQEAGSAKKDKPAQSSRSLERKKEVPQEPGYKALDMKPAYEGPRTPEFAPAPQTEMRPQEQRALKDEASPGKSTPQAAPESTRAKGFSEQESSSQTPAAAMAKKKAESFDLEDKRAATARAETGKRIFTLAVSDIDEAAAQVENAVNESGGKILRKEPADGPLSVLVAIDPAEKDRFIVKLKTVGELKAKDAEEIRTEGTTIEIRIVKRE